MKVFNTYFKVAKANVSSILIYVFIFLGFTMFISSLGNTSTEFKVVKPKVAIFDFSKSELSVSFSDYVRENSKIVDIDFDDVKDNLFFRKIDYVLIIPSDFELGGKIDTMSVPGSNYAMYSEMLFNRYFNILKTYVENEIPLSQAISLTKEVIIDDSNVEVLPGDDNSFSGVNAYYNFSNYTILAISIFVIGLITKVFNRTEIKKRTLVSFIPMKKVNFKLFLGNLVMAFLLFVFVNLIALLIFTDVILSLKGLLLVLNSLVFIFSAMSFAFLIGNLIKNKDAQNGVVNIVGLGSSFISGAFVPQFLLDKTVLLISTIFPSYYFINNNDYICLIEKFTSSDFNHILINYGVMALFALCFFILNLVLVKKRV